MPVLSRLGRPLYTRAMAVCQSRTYIGKWQNLPKQQECKIRQQPPPNENGHFAYELHVDDYKRYKPYEYFADDHLIRFLYYDMDHEWGFWPFIGMVIINTSLVLWIWYVEYNHIEIRNPFSNGLPPWDWEACRENYWKLPIIAYDPSGEMRKPLDEQFTKLNDDMLAAAKERGTRP